VFAPIVTNEEHAIEFWLATGDNSKLCNHSFHSFIYSLPTQQDCVLPVMPVIILFTFLQNYLNSKITACNQCELEDHVGKLTACKKNFGGFYPQTPVENIFSCRNHHHSSTNTCNDS